MEERTREKSGTEESEDLSPLCCCPPFKPPRPALPNIEPRHRSQQVNGWLLNLSGVGFCPPPPRLISHHSIHSSMFRPHDTCNRPSMSIIPSVVFLFPYPPDRYLHWPRSGVRIAPAAVVGGGGRSHRRPPQGGSDYSADAQAGGSRDGGDVASPPTGAAEEQDHASLLSFYGQSRSGSFVSESSGGGWPGRSGSSGSSPGNNGVAGPPGGAMQDGSALTLRQVCVRGGGWGRLGRRRVRRGGPGGAVGGLCPGGGGFFFCVPAGMCSFPLFRCCWPCQSSKRRKESRRRHVSGLKGSLVEPGLACGSGNAILPRCRDPPKSCRLSHRVTRFKMCRSCFFSRTQVA